MHVEFISQLFRAFLPNQLFFSSSLAVFCILSAALVGAFNCNKPLAVAVAVAVAAAVFVSS